MPRRKRGRPAGGALGFVRQAREAAKSALHSLRNEIRSTQVRLERLVAEERSFREELFGAVGRVLGRRPGRPRKAAARRPAPARRRARRKGPPKAERFFVKLPNTFTLQDVRKVAGRAAGISLAQWSRAKRIRKSGDKYQKVA
jgi:hypothetical protein